MQTGVLFVHSDGDPMALAGQVREAIRVADPAIAVFGIEPLKTTLVSSVGQRRFAMMVMAVFGFTTLLLAMIGIYGVLSYATEQRTREIGIRAALGASRERVVGLVVRQGALLTAAGLGLGIAGALAGSKLLAGLLFGVGRRYPHLCHGPDRGARRRLARHVGPRVACGAGSSRGGLAPGIVAWSLPTEAPSARCLVDRPRQLGERSVKLGRRLGTLLMTVGVSAGSAHTVRAQAANFSVTARVFQPIPW